jgi:hypothetical protein
MHEGPLDRGVVKTTARRGHLGRPGPGDFHPRLFERQDERLRLAGPVHHDRRRLVLGHQGGDLIDDPTDALLLGDDLYEDAVVVHPTAGRDA